MSNHGLDLRGAAPPPEDAGFIGALEVVAKATQVKVALETAVPMAADGLARMCPHRARKEDEQNVDKLEIQDTPSPGSPFQQWSTSKQQPSNNEDERPIESNITTANNPVLRFDKEVRSLLDKERNKYTELLDTTIGRTVDMVMAEQRTELLKQDEKLEDKKRIVIKKDEAIRDQLTELMILAKMNTIENTLRGRRLRPGMGT